MNEQVSSGSVGFDRAAEFYDATRVLPPETVARMDAMLAAQLHRHGPCLEIGVGTGRIALPLARAGIDVTGIDISWPMVSKLIEKSGSPALCRLAVADATALPFATGSFGAGLGVHVLHLMAEWRTGVAELVRVVRPGGLLLFDVGSADPSRRGGWQGPAREIEERFLAESGLERRHPGITDVGDLDRLLESLGARGYDLDPIVGTLQVPPGVLIRLFEEGVFAWTWALTAESRRDAARVVRAWAADRYGDLDAAHDLEVVVQFRAYELAAG